MSVAPTEFNRLIVVDGTLNPEVQADVQGLILRAEGRGLDVIRYTTERDVLAAGLANNTPDRQTFTYASPIVSIDDDALWLHLAQGSAGDDWPAHVVNMAGSDDLLVITGVDPWIARRLSEFIPPDFAHLPQMCVLMGTEVGRCGQALVWRNLRQACIARPGRIQIGFEDPDRTAKYTAPSLRSSLAAHLRICDILAPPSATTRRGV